MDLYNVKTADMANDMATCLIRFASQDFLDYRKINDTISGGSDGCINFEDEANQGLKKCLLHSNIASVYQKYCISVSLADFTVIAAEAMLARTSKDYSGYYPFYSGSLA